MNKTLSIRERALAAYEEVQRLRKEQQQNEERRQQGRRCEFAEVLLIDREDTAVE